MQFKSKLNPSHPVAIDEDTKVALCLWYDNNDAALGAPPIDPKKLIVKKHDDKWVVSYPFNAKYPTILGTCSEEPV
jgi:hypothetical protein